MKFHDQMMVRDIVLSYPAASDMFKKLKIDFCCGGNRPLAEAAASRQLDPASIIQQLQTQYDEAPAVYTGVDWKYMSSRSLIDYIVNKHHRYLEEQLPMIAANVARVYHVHGAEQPHLQEMHRLFGELRAELETHTANEEAEQFPALIQAEEMGTANDELVHVAGAIAKLESEHSAAGELLRQIREATSDFTVPEHACTTYRVTYARLEELEAMTFEHVHLENNVLFPRFL
ncbi:iron-sulfur cluster repair di-iron protein [Paenibacillus sp. ACRRX]|uniref:iron-sulfur cluster repair di-iron protein n=1 Tax=Paenibacillus sp. ACRRX TaxID=2918206 RepID=UPI001EF69FBC|nr:iron-sulfur cluster repair di-iron protein [Paenibacillus sp. ACRRX]MCG7406252.1 iron-sulfur cluster repair di-iron protein [Paenibacillus sp. ACRRX]